MSIKEDVKELRCLLSPPDKNSGMISKITLRILDELEKSEAKLAIAKEALGILASSDSYGAGIFPIHPAEIAREALKRLEGE